MMNRKKSMLMSTVLLGSLVTLAKPSIKAEAVKPNHFVTNVTPVRGGEYELDNGFPVPIALRVGKKHRDYKFMAENGMYARDGHIYLYLQSYKDQVYYYTPLLREYSYGSPKKSDGINRDVMLKLQGTSLWPNYSKGKGDDWLAGNSIKGSNSRGQTDNSNLTKATKGVKGLHHTIPGTNKPDYNFRTKTAIPPAFEPWSPEYLRDTDAYNSDNFKQYGNRWEFGEYRQLGYHPSGVSFVNPFFPVDGMSPVGSPGFENYPALQYPWGRAANRNDGSLISEIDEKVYQYAMYKGWIPLDSRVNSFEKRTHRQNYDKSIVWNQTTINDYKEAYNIKWYTMRDAYEKSTRVRNNRRIRGMSKSNAIQALTIKYASLSSSPIGTDANLSIAFGRDYEPSLKTWYSVNITIPGEIFTTKIQDIKLRNQRIYDGGLLQTFTRFPRGNGYDTKLTNNSGVGLSYPEVRPGSSIRMETFVDIDDSYKSETNAKGILHMYNSENLNQSSYALPNNGKIQKNGSTFVKWVQIPKNKAGRHTIYTELNKPYYNTSMDMRADNEENTAYNIVEIARDRGDIVPVGMDLIDENNNVVAHPIPGHEYKIRYRYRYDAVIQSNVERTADVQLTYDIGREMRGPVVSGYENSGKRTLYPINTGRNSKLWNGKEFVFETPYHVYETGQLDSQNVLDANVTDKITTIERWTSCSTNAEGAVSCTPRSRTIIEYDYYSLDASDGKDWITNYDLSVENIHVIPRDIENAHTQVSPALVKFDINYKTPSFIKDLGHDIDVAVKVGDQVIETKQHVRSGLNRNISIPVDTVYLGNQNSLINAEVFINHNKQIYESDDGIINIKTTNNYGTGQGRVKRPSVVPFKDNNNYATWNQYFNKNNWQGQSINYNSFSGPNIQFNRFTRPDNQRSEYRNFYEEYKIDAVRFRSRLTRQEEMGPNKDGWVNLLEEDGYIKAGYGYELEIDVSYKTNADTNDYDQTGLSGQWSRPKITEPLLQDNVYVQLPNNAIRSVQGDGGTQSGLRLKSTQGTKLDKKWTFEVDGGSALGVDTIGRFYFGEEVTDGRYSINVFTPKIRGVNGKMTSAHSILEHLLYDSKNDLGIHVIGADVDDITDHINR